MPRLLERSVFVRAAFNAALYIIARQSGLDPAVVAAAPEQAPLSERKAWAAAMKVRRQAIYLTITLLDVPQADMARALGISRPAVTRLVREVEDQRDDPALDRALDELGFLTGAGI